MKSKDIPVAPAGSLHILNMHKLIAKARLLPAPTKIPKPLKRVKLGKHYDIYCAISNYKNPPVKTYFLRKKIKGQRHYLCMADTWESMLKHMRWNRE